MDLVQTLKDIDIQIFRSLVRDIAGIHSAQVGPSSDRSVVTEMILVCWPAIALVGMLCFSLGLCMGMMRHTCVYKKEQVQRECKDPDEITFADEEEGQKHTKKSLRYKDIRKRSDKDGKLEVLLPQSQNSKTHFFKECPGLNNANPTLIKTVTVCKFCQRNLKKIWIEERDDE